MTATIIDNKKIDHSHSAALALLQRSFDKPCATCETSEADLLPLTRILKTGFYNALEACFDGLVKEPKTILVIGGCRQWALARRLGFLLPHSKIWVVDPVAAIVQQAEETIHCRFEFVHSHLHHFSFQDQPFDLVLAHNIAEFFDSTMTTDPSYIQSVVSELQRMTRYNLLLSQPVPIVTQAMETIPGLQQATRQLTQELGCLSPLPALTQNFLNGIADWAGKPIATTWPLPWQMMMFKKPL